MQSVEMKPMFLPEVQNNPQPSPYLELIRSAQNSGQEYWQIWHLFAFRPDEGHRCRAKVMAQNGYIRK
jgi:hypothetical protein